MKTDPVKARVRPRYGPDAAGPRTTRLRKLRTFAAALGIAAAAIIVGSALLARDAASERHPTEVRTVVVRNACHHVVWLFYGLNAPVRSEDAVTLAGGQSSAQSMLEGGSVWLLDDDRSVLDSVGVGSSTTTVVIESSCRSIVAG